MKRFPPGTELLRPIILGVLLGATGTYLVTSVWSQVTQRQARQRQFQKRRAEKNDWPPREFTQRCPWYRLTIDDSGWSTGYVGTYEDLDRYLQRSPPPGEEFVIPVFPTVFAPNMVDRLYYDAILESDIEPGDKVLVIGAGSGADSWVVSRMTEGAVYVVDVNPMAIVNTRMTAHLAGFQIEPLVGDIRDVELPDGFRDFDFVVWNMPFLEEGTLIKERDFHDGDDGTILKAFLARLPSLLKPDGTAIVLNVSDAQAYITSPGVTTRTDGRVMVFVIPNG